MGANRSARPNASLRTLILMLNLVNTHFGLTQEKLLDIVPGYPDEEANAQRMFERDIEGLREAGFAVEVLEGRPPKYRIDRSSFADVDLAFTDDQIALVLKGAAAWGEQSATPVHSIANKVRGYANLPIDKLGSQTSYNLETGVDLQTLLSAISNDQPIEFDYASRRSVETREVAPLRLIARRQALYLWGLDLNRWEERLFRLSRFRSNAKPILEAGAVVAGEHVEVSFDESRFLVEPVLAVHKTLAPGVWFASTPLPSDHGLPVDVFDLPLGFELRLGRSDDIAFWESSILKEALGAVPLFPQHLARMVRQMLKNAAELDGPEHLAGPEHLRAGDVEGGADA